MYYGGETRKSKAHNKKIENNKKSMHINGVWQNKVGKRTRLYDKNNNEICVGDVVKYDNGRSRWKNKHIVGRVFWHYLEKSYVLAWEKNSNADEYKLESYEKCIIIPSDNGGRMHLEILDNVEEVDRLNDL